MKLSNQIYLTRHGKLGKVCSESLQNTTLDMFKPRCGVSYLPWSVEDRSKSTPKGIHMGGSFIKAYKNGVLQ